jgi:hypothetical protein
MIPDHETRGCASPDSVSPLTEIALSIVAFQLGLFGFTALYHLVLWKPPLTVASPTYWCMMQIE